jgi:hypothetical protein
MMPNLDPSPAPLVLADMLAMHAWNPNLDEATRSLCSWAAETIRLVTRDNHSQVARREVAELETEMYRRIAYGPQKGGAL